MAYLWVMVVGFIFCLGMLGGILFVAIRSAINPQDSTRIDLSDSPQKNDVNT